MEDRRVLLGRINGLFGVRGWLKIYSHTRPIDNIAAYERWFLNRSTAGRQSDWRPFYVIEARPHGGTLIAQLAADDGSIIDDRDTAANLLEADIAVARADMPDPAPGEYYWHDLIGLEVVNRQAQLLGRVSAMMETGANDVLVVTGECERLIPCVPDVIIDEVDLDAGRIRVDWEADF